MKKRLFTLLLLVPALSACSLLVGQTSEIRNGTSSSLLDFLYPGGEIPPGIDERVPQLALPLNVGIAFVPDSFGLGISQAQKTQLLEQVADAFSDRPYVRSIQTIPDAYLRRRGGVPAMQQVAALFDVDVIALVSYNQHQFTSDRDSAILYWTIVGAAVVKGSSNEVQTMIDTAVFDVESAKLLFRAPGLHRVQRNTTVFEISQDLRALSIDGFQAANSDMIQNLGVELDAFEHRVQQGETAMVVTGGSGSADWLLLATLALALTLHARRKRVPVAIPAVSS
ncbi:MAG: rhombotarget lipoprotein [Pseudomonadota bacterium]